MTKEQNPARNAAAPPPLPLAEPLSEPPSRSSSQRPWCVCPHPPPRGQAVCGTADTRWAGAGAHWRPQSARPAGGPGHVPAPPGLGGLPPRERASCPEPALTTASTSVPTQAGPTPPVLGAGPQAFVPVTPAAVLGDVHVPLCGTRTPVSSLGPGHLRPSEWSCWPQRETGLCVPSHSLASEQRPTALPGSPDLSPPGCGCRASPKGRGQEVVTNRCLVTLQTCSPGPPPGCVPGPPEASEGR